MSNAFAAPIPVRGVVEGFYGVPWTWQQRHDMINFIAEKGMNAYIYAPKDDPYHRDKWREPYPKKMCAELAKLNKSAENAGVQLIFAMSPGLDIDFTGSNKEADREAMLKKMQLMYDKGIRQFALFFDDIPAKDAEGQAAFINYIENVFIKRHKDIKPLIVVPTEYFLSDMRSDGRVSDYTAVMADYTDKAAVFLYTGAGCCPDGINEADVAEFKSYYRDNPSGLWWNYPVNDYMKEKPALGPLDKMAKEPQAEMFFVNPMERAELSKIAIATGAAYAQNPEGYDENKAWLNALQELYGENAVDMMLFAEANQRLENDWAHIGRQDTPHRTKLYKKLEKASGEEKQEIIGLLLEDTKARIEAYKRLQKNLPKKVLKECSEDLANGIAAYQAELKKILSE